MNVLQDFQSSSVKSIQSSCASFFASASLSFHQIDHHASSILDLILSALASATDCILRITSLSNLLLAVAHKALYKLLYSLGVHICAILTATSSSFNALPNQYLFIAVFS
jgi:hypothetical protein